MYPTIDDVIFHAAEACRSFAAYSNTFFNFEKRSGWLGWENWLTVEVGRRLNSPLVLPFYPYQATGEKLDLYVEAPVNLAVEIKTNYIDDEEAKKPRPMSRRVVLDKDKIIKLGTDIDKLLLVSTCFRSAKARDDYPKCVERDLRERFSQFQRQWVPCSSSTGFNSLLAMSIRRG